MYYSFILSPSPFSPSIHTHINSHQNLVGCKFLMAIGIQHVETEKLAYFYEFVLILTFHFACDIQCRETVVLSTDDI